MQLYICHSGVARFKGVSEPQTVISISRGSLAFRAFPADYPSGKASLEAPFKGLQAIIVRPADH